MLPPDNIDDLFRQKLDGHATPPAPDLWARLSLPPADADPTDTAFQDGLRGHATPPRRELWERLEDEHLRPRPRRRRAVAWWQLSAAAVLLLVLVGGALWGGLWQASDNGTVASRGGSAGPAGQLGTVAEPAAKAPLTTTGQTPEVTGSQAQTLATNQPASAASEKNQKISSPQATAPYTSTSSTPIASTTRPRRPATALRASASLQSQRSQPDVATGTLARHGGRKNPASQSPITSQPTPSVPATSDNNAPVLATTTPAAAPAAAYEVIEVEVRRGGGHPAPAVVAVAAVEAAPVAPTRRRGLRLGGLLRQADRLVHGESVNLAEATNLPESVTLQARLGGRVVSRTIQL